MGIATTFGVASTGTAISALSGAAATNAALAWLGGGALAAGGGGMAAGSAFLALAGPVGWAIAGVSVVASGLLFFKTKSDKERLENIYIRIQLSESGWCTYLTSAEKSTHPSQAAHGIRGLLVSFVLVIAAW